MDSIISAIRITIEIDVKHKRIGRDEVRSAWVHDRHVWPELRAENNNRQDGWADSADGSASKRDTLRKMVAAATFSQKAAAIRS